jgi:hypothetical protein
MSRAVSREYRIYLAIWRKALYASEPIVIKCGTLNLAISLRQGMYRAIRPFRDGSLNDEELRNAAEKFVVYLDKDNFILELKERVTLAALEEMFDEIGLDEEDLHFGDERRAQESLSKLLEEAEKPNERITPFYKRVTNE